MINDPDGPKVDTRASVEALQEVITALQAIDGASIPTASWGKSRTGEMARLTRELLRMDHLLNRAKVLVMDEYWYVKEPDETPTERATPA